MTLVAETRPVGTVNPAVRGRRRRQRLTVLAFLTPWLLGVTIFLGLSLTFGRRLADEATPNRRSKPVGVDGADLWTFVGISGATPPIDLAAWTYQGRVRKADYTLTFPGTVAGQVAHMRAKWVSTRGDAGPVSADLVRNIAA